MPDNSANNKRIAKNTIYLYIRMIFVLLISLYTTRVVLNILGVIDYGIYNVVAGFVSMFSFLNSSLTASIQRFYNYENAKTGETGMQKVYITSFVIQLIIALLVLITVETFGLWYINNKLVIPFERLNAAKILFHLSVTSMILVIVQVPYSAAVIAKEKMNYYAIIGIIDVILKLGIVTILPYLPNDNLISYSWLLLGVTLIDFLLYFIYAKVKFPALRLRFKYSFDIKILKSMLSFSGWSSFGSFAQVIRNQGLNLILNLFFGPVINAARGISFQIKSALVSFMSSIITASQPQIVESYAKEDFKRSKMLFFTISKISFILLYILALPCALEIDYILELWLGDTVPEHTNTLSRIILMTALVEILNWPVSIIIYASGKIRNYNLVTSIIGLLVLPLAYLILKLGASPEEVFLLSFIISCAVQISSIIIMCTVVPMTVSEYCRKVLLPTILVMLSTFFIPLLFVHLMNKSFMRLIIVFVISLLSVIIASYYLVLNQREKHIIIEYYSKIKGRILRKQ